MHLRPHIDLISFLKAVNGCKSDVLFSTNQGDVLNLKSELSKYVFAVIAPTSDVLYSAVVSCQDPDDYECLNSYLTNCQED